MTEGSYVKNSVFQVVLWGPKMPSRPHFGSLTLKVNLESVFCPSVEAVLALRPPYR